MRGAVGRAAWAIGAIAAIVVLAVAAAVVIGDTEDDGATALRFHVKHRGARRSRPRHCRDRRPQAACEEFTLDELAAPATAEFPDHDDRRVSIDRNGTDWTVRSFVDAENVAGANVRTSFVCVVRDAGDEWQLLAWSSP